MTRGCRHVLGRSNDPDHRIEPLSIRPEAAESRGSWGRLRAGRSRPGTAARNWGGRADSGRLSALGRAGDGENVASRNKPNSLSAQSGARPGGSSGTRRARSCSGRAARGRRAPQVHQRRPRQAPLPGVRRLGSRAPVLGRVQLRPAGGPRCPGGDAAGPRQVPESPKFLEPDQQPGRRISETKDLTRRMYFGNLQERCRDLVGSRTSARKGGLAHPLCSPGPTP
jgi:hypothetical protein